jgi:hypothetical protein
MTAPTFDGSFLGDITDNIIAHEGANYYRYGKNEFRYVKVHIEKIGTTNYTFDPSGNKISMSLWTDLMTDVLKGIFYLPSFGFHIGIIKSVSVSEDTEIITKGRYSIRPAYDEVLSLTNYLKKYTVSSSDTDLIERLKMFANILKIRDPVIELRKLNIGEKSFWVPTCRCRQQFIPNTDFVPSKDLFIKIQEFIKPFRSPLMLKYRMEKLLNAFFPERRAETEVWMDEVLSNLTETLVYKPSAEKVREPTKAYGSLPPIPEVPGYR